MPTARLAALAAALVFLAPDVLAQDAPFEITVTERTDLANAPALHSGVWAEHDGLWLFLAGRTNGLHSFGGDAFPREFENGDVVVYDPAADTQWSASLDGIAPAIAEHLGTTNPQGLHRGDSLIVVGGYGYRPASGEMVTFGAMTVVDVPGIIEAVQTGGDLAPHLRQPVPWDDALAVTGGHLVEFNGSLTLVGGQRFDGAYTSASDNPRQVYTEAIRTFSLGQDGLAGVVEITDPELHRRDGNVAPTVLADGTVSVGIYGGVFVPETQGAFVTPIELRPRARTNDVLEIAEGFVQHTGHYTAPVLPLYSAQSGAMHTVFLGGINGFTWSDDEGAWDMLGTPPFIPFTDDIAVITREGDAWSERYLGNLPATDRSPGLYGTNANVFLNPALPFHAPGIVDLDGLAVGTTTLGWFVGGIAAGAPSFGQTWASSRVFEMRLTRAVPPSTQPSAGLAFALGEAAPNPSHGTTTLDLTLDTPHTLRAEVFDATGRRIAVLHDGPLGAGTHALTWSASPSAPGLYLVRVTGPEGSASRRVVIAR